MLIAYDMSMCYESEVPEYSQLLSMYNDNRQYLCRVTRKTGLEQFGIVDTLTLCLLVKTFVICKCKSRSEITLSLIWIQPLWHSGGIPEMFFEKYSFEKNLQTTKNPEKLRSMQRVKYARAYVCKRTNVMDHTCKQ